MTAPTYDLTGPEFFTCPRHGCRMLRTACIARQKRNRYEVVRDGSGEKKFLPRWPECLGCRCGAGIMREAGLEPITKLPAPQTSWQRRAGFTLRHHQGPKVKACVQCGGPMTKTNGEPIACGYLCGHCRGTRMIRKRR